ncbi:MAG TPA: hydrogenase maturation peptidase HycI, partial [Syntrophomonadaceae bacterium]|nr:hydrogenase maturation peptidase HycI [Syntrophomonadaceae bacterium]
MKRLLFTVGNELMGDDAAGPLLARLLTRSPLDNWEVLNGGSAPENHIHKVREFGAEMVVVVDAAEMGLSPGSIRILSEEDIANQFLMTTHNLPLSFLIKALKETVPHVLFIGIQPKHLAFYQAVSPEVKEAVKFVYDKMRNGDFDFAEF